MIGQKEGWEEWEGQAEWEGLGSKDQSVLRNSWLFSPPPPILNDILLLKILFSEIYRAPKGQQLPLYPPWSGGGSHSAEEFLQIALP